VKKLVLEYLGAFLASALTIPPTLIVVPDPAFHYAIAVGAAIGLLLGKFLQAFLLRHGVARRINAKAIIGWLILVVACWAVYGLGWRGEHFPQTEVYLAITRFATGVLAFLLSAPAAMAGAEIGGRK